MSIKAIETHYKGYRFRSRLEARWAVFFDAAGIEYEYEPEGFEKSYEDGSKYRYLPDFYLPKTGTWVEVKGSDEAWQEALMTGLEAFLDWNSALPGMVESSGTKRGLLVLGEIPHVVWGVVAHPIIQHRKGLWENWAILDSDSLEIVNGTLADYLGIPTLESCSEAECMGWTTKARYRETPLAHKRLMEAYKKARMARFEHGECPA